MRNLSHKHNDLNDVDDFKAIRVGTDDKVDEFRGIGESSKEMDKEEVECVVEVIHTCADVSGNKMKNVVVESVETGKKVNKRVFGTAVKRKEHDVSGVDAKEKSERRQTKDPND
ncbi:hypothetical protein Tco_1012741, partial [Tanacetum coccineum]